jgi:hypothetical protein
MFAKGSIPGWSPKRDCLKIYPNAKCVDSGHRIRGSKVWFLYLNENGNPFSYIKPEVSESSPRLAWERLWCKLVDEGKLDKKGNKL